jgi:hypothetical protein
VVQGDAIVPYQEEIPYGKGQKGFVAPKDWKITDYENDTYNEAHHH